MSSLDFSEWSITRKTSLEMVIFTSKIEAKVLSYLGNVLFKLNVDSDLMMNISVDQSERNVCESLVLFWNLNLPWGRVISSDVRFASLGITFNALAWWMPAFAVIDRWICHTPRLFKLLSLLLRTRRSEWFISVIVVSAYRDTGAFIGEMKAKAACGIRARWIRERTNSAEGETARQSEKKKNTEASVLCFIATTVTHVRVHVALASQERSFNKW